MTLLVAGGANPAKTPLFCRISEIHNSVEPDGDIPHIPPVKLRQNMEEFTVDEEMIKQKLDNLNVCKSVGPDDVHPRLFKELSNHLCKPLARLFNNSLAVGELPKEWKQGRISAIFKKGNRKNAGNYRPVSLTSIICKCMSKTILLII